MKPAHTNPDQIWREYLIAVAKHQQLVSVNKNLRRLQARVRVQVIKVRK